jgi:metal-responsive CopG/Arc/MetJ family transcriptional regulator
MSMPHEALVKEAQERGYPGINELICEILRVYVQEMESDAEKPDSTYESLQKEAAEPQFPGVNELIRVIIRDYLEKRESDRDLKHENCGKLLNSSEYAMEEFKTQPPAAAEQPQPHPRISKNWTKTKSL